MSTFDFSSALCSWYKENKRELPWRHTNDPYAIWVSEIMLQQTRVEAVKPYFERFMQALPTVQDLAEADEELLNKLWQGLGYYSRVRNMQKAAKTCMSEHGGKLPENYEALRHLCGIGDYTAGAVASIAFGIPQPAIDGNVKRVLARYLCIESEISSPEAVAQMKDFVLQNIPKADPGSFNQGLIELGATLCGPGHSALCGGCPLLSSCRAFQEGRTEDLPLRAVKKQKRTEEKTLLILLYDDRIALEKRSEKGLLAGLWQLPMVDGFKTAKEIQSHVAAHGAAVQSIEALPEARHVFTHIVWEMRCFLVDLVKPGDFSFFDKEKRQSLAVPSAFNAYRSWIF